MSFFKNSITNYFKGIIIGFGTLIPGVSGGTTAIILGVFKELLESVSNIFINFKKSFLFLCPVFLGVSTGVLLLSSRLNIFCLAFPKTSKYIFCILALLSTFLFVKKVLFSNFKKKHFAYMFCGIILALLLSILISTNKLDVSENAISLILIGILLSIALILPAISFSYMLLFFGIYQTTLSAIEAFELRFIVPLSIGVIFGSYIFSKILNKMLDRHPTESYSFVLGFVLTSIVDILR